MIINTHSPNVVQLVDPRDLLFADAAMRQAPDGTVSPALQLRPLADTWRAATSTVPPVTRADILPYLTEPPGAQLRLEIA